MRERTRACIMIFLKLIKAVDFISYPIASIIRRAAVLANASHVLINSLSTYFLFLRVILLDYTDS
jgi:hypothetical protein